MFIYTYKPSTGLTDRNWGQAKITHGNSYNNKSACNYQREIKDLTKVLMWNWLNRKKKMNGIMCMTIVYIWVNVMWIRSWVWEMGQMVSEHKFGKLGKLCAHKETISCYKWILCYNEKKALESFDNDSFESPDLICVSIMKPSVHFGFCNETFSACVPLFLV